MFAFGSEPALFHPANINPTLTRLLPFVACCRPVSSGRNKRSVRLGHFEPSVSTILLSNNRSIISHPAGCAGVCRIASEVLCFRRIDQIRHVSVYIARKPKQSSLIYHVYISYIPTDYIANFGSALARFKCMCPREICWRPTVVLISSVYLIVCIKHGWRVRYAHG